MATSEGLLNDFDPSAINNVNDEGFFLGYSFVVEHDVQVNSLGAYQPNATWSVYPDDPFGDMVETEFYGNTAPAHVGLYDDSGLLLTEVEVPFCCTGDFNYASISPVDLSAGSTYHLVMMTGDGVYFGYGSGAESITFDSNFTITEMRSKNTNSCCSSLPSTLPENSNSWSFEYVFADLTYELLGGCTDATACNYDETATTDDDSCEFTSCLDLCGVLNGDNSTCTGCTYEYAEEYNPNAIIDDGSCSENIACPGDFSGDGFVNVSDLGGFLGAFGESCE